MVLLCTIEGLPILCSDLLSGTVQSFFRMDILARSNTKVTTKVVYSSSAKYEAPKFDGETRFSLWKTKMMMILVSYGLWKAIEKIME